MSDTLDTQITKTTAAAEAGVTERSIDRAISRGELTVVHRLGRVFIERADLARWISARQTRQHGRSGLMATKTALNLIRGLTKNA